ncbi:hypothetical protein ACEQ8H_005656 [Pleosporales sp. CAS-2024a]
MDADPLPDHFKALGVDKTADAAAVKKAYRLLALHCHPDKVTSTDPAVKQEKADQFHKIQQAYEVLVDDNERAKYEANITLHALRKEKLARGAAATSRDKSARFEPRPSANTSSSRYATEERKPSPAYPDDDKFYDDRDRERARAGGTRTKYDTYSAYPKPNSSPRTDKESSRTAKAASDRSRAERAKTRDKEDRRNHKFVSVDSESSSADEKARYEAAYKRRSHEEEVRRQGDARRKTDDRRSYEEPRYESRAQKMTSQAEEAQRYLNKSREQAPTESRPAPARTSSRDYYDATRQARTRDSRPEPVRRSSAQPKERTASSGARDREARNRERGIIPEIVNWDADDSSSRRMPTLNKHTSSPGKIEIPRAMPERRYTEAPTRDKKSSTSPPPAFHRSATMPTSSPHSSSRSKPANVSRPSGLRETMTPAQSIPEAFASVPPPQAAHAQAAPASKTKYYHYPTPGGGVPLHPDDILAGGHRTVLREPGSTTQRHRSPESVPLSRPPIGPNRPSEANISRTAMPPPPMGRSSSSPIREERGRSGRPLYGEIRSDSYSSQRPRPLRQPSFNPNDVQYAPKYGPEDVRWAPPRGRENERSDYGPTKPTISRTATYVY